MPAPRLTVSAAGRLISAESTAEEVEVLPMPISPMPTTSMSACFASAARSAPTSMAFTHSARVMAGSRAKFLVPWASLRSHTPGCMKSASMPTSTTSSSVPKCFASTATPVSPRVKLMVCASVTDCGALATPSWAMPLSDANMITRRFSMRLNTCPVMPASFTLMSSSLPRLWGGLARLSWRARAASMAP